MDSLKTAFLLAAVGATPLAAQTACPTAEDLGAGVQLTLEDGTIETFRPLTADVIRVTGGDVDEGETYSLDLGKGVFTLVFQDLYEGELDASARSVYAYPVPPGELPDITPNATFELQPVVLEFGDLYGESERYETSAAYDLQIGDCTYEAIDILVSYGDDDTYVDGLTYITELGIAYLAFWVESDERTDTPAANITVVQ
ncbi:hypothetical protein [Pelagovum pacificum]|uniref:Uncharacterized protein n=1 Tax=Pelagovum pacificum TaxID=2588711 RepID=A0A5C5G9G4_9RHOB|nr:hypothetical protein [Pelagovum pacificum]QQA42237.1 hypothetical protein I8N54_15795 [Pelagovum pacificum]TNY31321.1 hypothetical protein FHY64_14985 [Pelagovum pacificum]